MDLAMENNSQGIPPTAAMEVISSSANNEQMLGGKTRALLRARSLGLPVPEFVWISLHTKEELDLKWIRSRLGDGPFFVRTSFVGEDEEMQSFAGIGTSVGHVPLQRLREAVARVRASWESILAREYRKEKGLLCPASGTILIQKEVVPLYSGVFFTRSPQAVGAFYRLEAVRGYGEDLVRGRVEPIIIEGHECKGVFLGKAPPRPFRRILRKLLLYKEKFREITGEEADVEWVYDQKDKLWILQIRPLVPSPPILSHSLAQEFWSGRVSPLMYSAIGSLIEEAMLKEPFRIFTRVPERMLQWKRGYIYIDLRPLIKALALLPPWAVSEETLQHFPPVIRERYLKEARVYHPLLSPALLEVLFRFLKQRAPWLPLLQPFLMKRFRSNPLLTSPPPGEKERLMGEIRSLRKDLAELLRLVVWGMVYSYIATPLLHRLLGKGFRSEYLYRALPLDPVKDFLADLREFSQSHRETIARILSSGKGKDPQGIFRDFLQALDPLGKEGFLRLMERWAHRGENRDLSSPRIGEDPFLLWELLRLSYEAHNEGSASPWWQELLELRERRGLWRRLVTLGFLSPLILFTRLYLGFREAMRDLADRYLYALRQRFMRLAELERKFPPWEYAWSDEEGFLPFPGIEEDARGNGEGEKVPLFYIGDTPLAPTPVLFCEFQITGVPICAGIGEGRGVFVKSTRNLERFSPGDVLLAPYLDPTYAVALRRASAGVFAYGGMLSHGAILAREFGIPVVTGVPEAILEQWEGKYLRVDGFRGMVEIRSDGQP